MSRLFGASPRAEKEDRRKKKDIKFASKIVSEQRNPFYMYLSDEDFKSI